MSCTRSGRYRKTLFEPERLETLVSGVWPKIREGRALWQSGVWSAAEWTADVLLLIWQASRPTSWANGPLERRAAGDLFAGTKLDSFAETSPLRLFSATRLRGIPSIAQTIVLDWHFGRLPLDLKLEVPSADEVLAAECEGRRCVSLLVQSPKTFANGFDGRDGFSFVLHDLIHALKSMRLTKCS